ncbi:hypothetical protein [Streptomyces sp. Agncl-13]|jgi:hypothetical protein
MSFNKIHPIKQTRKPAPAPKKPAPKKPAHAPKRRPVAHKG